MYVDSPATQQLWMKYEVIFFIVGIVWFGVSLESGGLWLAYFKHSCYLVMVHMYNKEHLGTEVFIKAWLFVSPLPWCIFNFLSVFILFFIFVKSLTDFPWSFPWQSSKLLRTDNIKKAMSIVFSHNFDILHLLHVILYWMSFDDYCRLAFELPTYSNLAHLMLTRFLKMS